MGKFLVDNCFNPNLKCQNVNCKRSARDHVLSFVHKDGRVDITVGWLKFDLAAAALASAGMYVGERSFGRVPCSKSFARVAEVRFAPPNQECVARLQCRLLVHSGRTFDAKVVVAAVQVFLRKIWCSYRTREMASQAEGSQKSEQRRCT